MHWREYGQQFLLNRRAGLPHYTIDDLVLKHLRDDYVPHTFKELCDYVHSVTEIDTHDVQANLSAILRNLEEYRQVEMCSGGYRALPDAPRAFDPLYDDIGTSLLK